MKKYIVSIMLAASLMFMPGCSLIQDKSVQQISSIVLNGPILINDIEMVYERLSTIQKNDNIFSEDELDIFDESMSTFSMVKTEYETLIALEMIPSTEDAMIMWRQAREAYNDSIDIIQKKRDKYDRKTLISIDIMDAHAKRADIDVMALLSNPTTTNLSQVLKIIGGFVNIGVKVAVLL